MKPIENTDLLSSNDFYVICLTGEIKMESMLFNYETTYKTSYKGHEMRPPIRTSYKKKQEPKQRESKPSKDVHTLTDWKSDAIRFDLLIRPKPIIRTNPLKTQEKYTKPCYLHREQAQKTRPRIVMTPAVSMDDIENPKTRELLCVDMYTSDTTRELREAVFPYLSIRAPLPGLPAPSNPILLPKLQPAYVAPEWRMETVSWDNAQLRAYCNPARDFWLAREPKCGPCDESTAVQLHRRKLCQAKIERY